MIAVMWTTSSGAFGSGGEDGLVLPPAEQRQPAHGHAPVRRHLDLDAAPEHEHRDLGLPHDLGLAQVRLDPAHDGGQRAPLEVLRPGAAVRPPPQHRGVDPVRVLGGAPRVSGDQRDPDQHQDHGPGEVPEADVDQVEALELEEDADRDDDRRPHPGPRHRDQGGEAEPDDEQRPPGADQLPEVGVDQVEPAQEGDRADGDEEQTEEQLRDASGHPGSLVARITRRGSNGGRTEVRSRARAGG